MLNRHTEMTSVVTGNSKGTSSAVVSQVTIVLERL